MIIDAKSKTISLDIPPEDYKIIYYFEPRDYEIQSKVLSSLNSLLTFTIDSDNCFKTSIIDFFDFREILKTAEYKIELNLTKSAMDVCKKFIEKVNNIKQIKEGKWNDKVITTLKNEPYFDQKSAIAFLTAIKTGSNFSSVGIGKTISALGAFNILKDANMVSKCLVFSLNENKHPTWFVEVCKHTNYKCKIIGNGTVNVLKDIEEFDKEDILVIHYDALINNEVVEALMAKHFDFWVVDECHTIANMKAKRTKAIHALYKNAKPQYLALMSGTPINDDPLLSYFILKLIQPNLLPSKGKFDSYFCKMFLVTLPSGRKFNKINGYKNLDKLKKLMDLYTFRKTQKDVKGFPKLILCDKEIELESDQRMLYNRIVDETYQEIASSPDKVMNLNVILVKLLRLRQFLSSPTIFGEKNVSNAKLNFLDVFLEEVMQEKDQKIVVWTSFTPTLNLLHERYKKYGTLKYMGVNKELSREDRNDNIEKFKTDKNSRMLVGQASLATGISLSNCNLLVMFDTLFIRRQFIQCLGRITRRDSVSDVARVFTFKCKDTIDQWLEGLIGNKNTLIDQILDYDFEANTQEESTAVDKKNILDFLKGEKK